MLSMLEIISEQLSSQDFKNRMENLYSVIFADALTVKKRQILKAKLLRCQQAAVFLIDSVGKNPALGKQLANLLSFKKLDFPL